MVTSGASCYTLGACRNCRGHESRPRAGAARNRDLGLAALPGPAGGIEGRDPDGRRPLGQAAKIELELTATRRPATNGRLDDRGAHPARVLDFASDCSCVGRLENEGDWHDGALRRNRCAHARDPASRRRWDSLHETHSSLLLRSRRVEGLTRGCYDLGGRTSRASLVDGLACEKGSGLKPA
jgi:hypothetical protein